MIHSSQFTCVLDTNVIFPIEIRDLLFWFAFYELFTPKWSDHIFDEWEAVMRRKGRANKAFPDALVQNYDGLIATLTLPDPKDCHVLAAAIKTNANLIVTNNIKDFSKSYLATFGLAAKTSDNFLADIIDLNPQEAVQAFRELVMNRRNPNLDEFQVLEAFKRNGLQHTADALRTLI